MKVGLLLGVCLFLNVYTDSQLLFKATDFGLAVCQLESQTLGWLFAVATLKSRGWVSLALLLPAQLCHPLGQRWRETEEREADIWTGNVKTHSLQGSTQITSISDITHTTLPRHINWHRGTDKQQLKRFAVYWRVNVSTQNLRALNAWAEQIVRPAHSIKPKQPHFHRHSNNTLFSCCS